MNLIYLLASPHHSALSMVLGTAALVRDEEHTFWDWAFSFHHVDMTFKLRLLGAGTSTCNLPNNLLGPGRSS